MRIDGEGTVDIQVRAASPADAGPISRIHVDTWRATYVGIVPTEHLASLAYPDRESRWDKILTTDQPATSYFVAETDVSEIVGFASGGPEREGNHTYRGEIYAIYVLKEYQGQGIGRRLVSTLAERFLADGLASMLVWVLTDNHPACRFYESLGGEQVGRKKTTIGGTHLEEVAYGWRDIASLRLEPAV